MNGVNQPIRMAAGVDLSSTLNNLDIAIFIVDERGIILYRNEHPKVFSQMVDQPLQVGDSVMEIIPHQWKAYASAILTKVASNGAEQSFELQKTTNSGTRVFFDVHVKACKDISGYPGSVHVEIHDATVRKVFERKSAKASSEMFSLLENANAIVIGLDSQGYITHWNESATSIMGYGRDEVLATTMYTILHCEKCKSQFSEILTTVLGGTSMTNTEITVRTKDGRKKILLASAICKFNSKGSPVGISIVAQDITELLEYRNSLEEKVEMRTKELLDSYEEIKRLQEIAEFEREKSDELLRNILPDSIAVELKKNGHVKPVHYELVTVVFADLVGFTLAGKNLMAESILHELSYLFTGFDMIVEKNGLEKIKTMGDGYMAVGGVPNGNRTNPEDAVRAALEMISFARHLSKVNHESGKPGWSLRVGIHSGDVVAGVVGKNKFAYDVWGETVNVANRLEQASQGDRINLSEATYHLVKHRYNCAYRGPIEVKNMGTMKMYFVEDELKA